MHKCAVLIGKKSIDGSIKDELIITATITGTFFGLKTVKLKLSKASLDAMDVMKLAGAICIEE